MYTILTQRNNSDIKDTFRVPNDIDRFYYNNLAAVDESIEIHFEADPLSDAVSWKIGTDTRIFTQRKFLLQFQSPIGKVDVRLIQRRTPNKACFPADDGVDTLYKSFNVVNGLLDNPVLGRFKGYMVGHEQDTFTVTTHFYTSTPGLEGYYFIKNFPKGSDGITVSGGFPRGQGDVIKILGNRFNFYTERGFAQLYGKPLVHSLATVQNDSLIVKYKLDGSKTTETFIGLRQQ
jgi:hypothetical protein